MHFLCLLPLCPSVFPLCLLTAVELCLVCGAVATPGQRLLWRLATSRKLPLMDADNHGYKKWCCLGNPPALFT